MDNTGQVLKVKIQAILLFFGGLLVLWAEHRPAGGITQVVRWLHVEAGMGTGGCVEIVAERGEAELAWGSTCPPLAKFHSAALAVLSQFPKSPMLPMGSRLNRGRGRG